MSKPQELDSITIPAITDMDSHWFGITIDKSKFDIVLENVTEETVYLKIVLKKTYGLKRDEKLSEVIYAIN